MSIEIEPSTSQNRAQVYWWLSSLMAEELGKKQLDMLFSNDVNLFLEALADEDELVNAVSLTKQAIDGLRVREDVELELAADYAKLFLGNSKQGALPYASVYLGKDGLLMQEPHHRMLQLLSDNGFARSEEFKEPADHLAIILDFMGNLAVKEAGINIQQLCLDELLLNWLPEWRIDAGKFDDFGFYGAVSLMILEFCRLDSNFLKQ